MHQSPVKDQMKNKFSAFIVCAVAAAVLVLTSTIQASPSDESDVRAAIQRVFDQLKSAQYEALYDGLPSSTRARITKDRFVSALRRTQNLYQLDRIEIGAIRVSGTIAVADTTMYAHLGKPFDTDGKLVVQQYLVSEVYGQWSVATGNKAVISRFLNANPSFARKFPIKKPRAFINRDGNWIEVPFGQR
jgi:hypothetical protein